MAQQRAVDNMHMDTNIATTFQEELDAELSHAQFMLENHMEELDAELSHAQTLMELDGMCCIYLCIW